MTAPIQSVSKKRRKHLVERYHISCSSDNYLLTGPSAFLQWVRKLLICADSEAR